MYFTKITFCLALLLFPLTYFAQSPYAFKYQAVVRDATGAPHAGQTVGFRATVRQGSATGTVIYQETSSYLTNGFGLLTVNVGESNLLGFAAIDWKNGPYFLETEIDPAGGSAYAISGVSQLLSVPFALYADESALADSAGYAVGSGEALYADTAFFAFEAEYAEYAVYAEEAGVADSVVVEHDPFFAASAAAGVTAGDTAAWREHVQQDRDLSSANELQDLTLAGDTLALSQGGFVVLPQAPSNWRREGDSLFFEDGQVGIGTASPEADLEVAGTFRLEDGSQGAGRYLRSDSSGLARWVEKAQPFTFYFTNPNWEVTGTGNTEVVYCSGTIELAETSLVHVNSSGHMNSYNGDVGCGIAFPGLGESLSTGNNTLMWDLKQGNFVSGSVWHPVNASRSIILPPGSHEIRLYFGGFNNSSGQLTLLHGSSLSGFVIPLD